MNQQNISQLFATRLETVSESFIREILKVTQNPEIISFAGGLPNPKFFPVEEVLSATTNVLVKDGHNALQYTTTAGYYPLRLYIAERYQQIYGLTIDPNNILITNGSQQGLDLVGKIFLNSGDRVIIEQPGYLGAIQSFSLYEPTMHAVPLQNDGIDVTRLADTIEQTNPKLFYTVPTFQNPSGITYSAEKREQVAKLVQSYPLIVVEDNPYGELRFAGETLPPLTSYLGEQAILLGSFSKVVAPGLRLGWICASPPIIQKLHIAKQAADLHSNYVAQRIIYQYLQENDLEAHLQMIRQGYKQHRDLMISLLQTEFPPEVRYTEPEGGMFVWVTLPDGISAMQLFEQAIQQNVAFVPGQAFYINDEGENTLRLNYSNANEEKIETGMRRLAAALRELG